MHFLITIGSPRCKVTGARELKKVERDVNAVTKLLTLPPQEYIHVLSDRLAIEAKDGQLTGPDSGTVRTALGAWFADSARTERDYVIVYVAGHGDNFNKFKAHCLLTSDSSDDGNMNSVLKTEDLVDLFFNPAQAPKNVLLILDVCYAGKGAGSSLARISAMAESLTGESGFWVVATSDQNTEAVDGAFVEELIGLLGAGPREASDDAYLPAGGGTPYLSPWNLAYAVNERLAKKGSAQRLIPHGGFGAELPKFIRNPWFDGTITGAVEVDMLTHWGPKARGHDTPASMVSFFTGREAALSELRNWLKSHVSDGRARVVTGAPGAGKSAVLGRLILEHGAASPQLVRVHARGRNVDEVIRTVAEQLKLTAATPARLVEKLFERIEPVAVVVDALDEAAGPGAIETELLSRLVGCPAVRLIVGARRKSDVVLGSGMKHVSGVVPLESVAKVIELDADDYFNPRDVEDYSFSVLTATAGRMGSYLDQANHARARRVARVVANRAGRSFLYARVASHRFASRPPVETSVPDWEKDLPPVDPGEMFASELERFGDDARRFADLLIPLAFARRRGLPQKNIWSKIASRIAGKEYTNEDIAALKSRAGFYLIQDTEDAETVFRLFHQSFADHLRNVSRDRNPEGAFAEALEEWVAEVGGWERVREPYVLWAFPSHAAAGNRLGEAMSDPAFLLAAPPSALRPELVGVRNPKAWSLAQSYRRAYHRLVAPDRGEAASYLQLAALQYQTNQMTAGLREAATRSAWWPQWAIWKSSQSSWVAAETGKDITALCTTRDANGNPVAVSGHADGSVSSWRLDTSEFIRCYTSGIAVDDEVTRLLSVPYGGSSLLIAVWKGRSVRVYYTLTAELLGMWKCPGILPLKESLRSAVSVEAHGTSFVAVACEKHLWLFELPTLTLRQYRDDVTKGAIDSISGFRSCHEVSLVTGSDTLGQIGKHETNTLKRWKVPELELVRDGNENRPIDGIYSFDLAGQQYFLSRSRNEYIVRNPISLDPVSEPIDTWGAFIAALPRGEQTQLIFKIDDQMVVFTVRLISEGQLAIERTNTEVDLIGGIGRVVMHAGQQMLVTCKNDQIHVLDLDEAIRPLNLLPSSSAGSFPNVNVSHLASHGGMLFVVNEYNEILARSANGGLSWRLKFAERVSQICLSLDGAVLVVLSRNDNLFQYDTETGHESASPFRLDDNVLAIALSTAASRNRLVSAVELSAAVQLSCVRIWDLASQSDVTPTGDPEHYGFYYARSNSNVTNLKHAGFVPELAMDDYVMRKPLTCVATVLLPEGALVAFAGRNSRVKVVDMETLEEWASWTAYGRAGLVATLCAAVIHGRVHVFGSVDQCLFRAIVSKDSIDQEIDDKAHGRKITALSLCETPRGWVLATGCIDQYVRLWTPDLKLIYEIDVLRPVSAVTWLDGELVVGTDRGILAIQINWDYAIAALNK